MLLSGLLQDATADKVALAEANQELQSQLDQQSKVNSALISQLAEAQLKVTNSLLVAAHSIMALRPQCDTTWYKTCPGHAINH